jgi:glycosyltransferase involved in cell wall biosynthesis
MTSCICPRHSFARSLSGFINQSQLPAVYTSADLMVLPSDYEPFAVVVNEAMRCGCPVVASDHVGAARDLVAPAAPQLIFPCGHPDLVARAQYRRYRGRHSNRGCTIAPGKE